MKEPALLKCLFIYKNDKYGCPIYRTNRLNWRGIKYLIKKCGIKIWKSIKYLLQYIIPAIIGYFLGQGA